MLAETRDVFLLTQLQEGLRYGLMKSPAVSGAQGYRELCTASRNEKKQLAANSKTSGPQGRTTRPGTMSGPQEGARPGTAKQVNVTSAGEQRTEWNPLLLDCLYTPHQEGHGSHQTSEN